MRLLEYRLDLFGRGYSVISGNRHYESMNKGECLPIKMHRLTSISRRKTCDRFDDLVENLEFGWAADKAAEEKLREKFTNILLGKSPEWIIVGFSVMVGRVYIDLYNIKTKEGAFYSLKADEYGFDLCFEVPRTDGGPCAIYDVEIGGVESAEKNARTTVTEYISHVRREIEFFCKIPNGEVEDSYIEVTEYADM